MPNTPNQGYPLAQLGDPPTQLPAALAQLAALVDTKAAGFDADAARVAGPALVKISGSNYVGANDPQGTGPQFDTVEYNRGTPTDLTAFQGVTVNKGLWIVGLEVTYLPTQNNVWIEPTLSTSGPTLSTGMHSLTVTVGYPNFFGNQLYGYPLQYCNLTMIGVAFSDNTTYSAGFFGSGLPVNTTCRYFTLWAAQIGDV